MVNVKIENITKKYGKTKALDNMSLAIEAGEVIALLGLNGAGKTTLLRAFAGLISLSQGTVLYDNKIFNPDNIELKRGLLFLPDFPLIFGDMTPVQYFGMLFRLYEKSTKGLEHKLLILLDDFDMLVHSESIIETLSRGQLYKIALIGMIALDLDLWLLDEPFASGMDPVGLAQFKKYVRLARKNGKTVIYSTQILEVNERFCDKLCIIDKGKIIAFDAFEVIRNNAKNMENSKLITLFSQLRE